MVRCGISRRRMVSLVRLLDVIINREDTFNREAILNSPVATRFITWEVYAWFIITATILAAVIIGSPELGLLHCHGAIGERPTRDELGTK